MLGHEVTLVPLHPGAISSTSLKIYSEADSVEVLPDKLFDLKTLFQALAIFFLHPLRVIGILIELHFASGLNFYSHAATLALFAKGLATAWRLRKMRIDQLHAHFAMHTTTFAAIVGKILLIDYSFTAHAYDIYCTTPKLRNDLLCWKLKNCNCAFVVSDFGKRVMSEKCPRSADRIHTAYVGVPTDLFQLHSHNGQDKTFELLCVTRLDHKKGLDTLIDACYILNKKGYKFHLNIFGDGPLRQSLKDQIARLALSECVHLGPAIDQKEVAHQISKSHAFVMPSRRTSDGDMDGIPTTFMEAMASGRPVISCPVSGIPELVRHEQTGLLVPSNEPTELANAIEKLGKDFDLRARLGQNAAQLARSQHDSAHNTRKLIQIWQSTKT